MILYQLKNIYYFFIECMYFNHKLLLNLILNDIQNLFKNNVFKYNLVMID